MSRTREQLRRRRWLRRIWLTVLTAAVAVLCGAAWRYAVHLGAEAKERPAVAETIQYWDLSALDTVLRSASEDGPRLYAARMEARP